MYTEFLPDFIPHPDSEDRFRAARESFEGRDGQFFLVVAKHWMSQGCGWRRPSWAELEEDRTLGIVTPPYVTLLNEKSGLFEIETPKFATVNLLSQHQRDNNPYSHQIDLVAGKLGPVYPSLLASLALEAPLVDKASYYQIEERVDNLGVALEIAAGDEAVNAWYLRKASQHPNYSEEILEEFGKLQKALGRLIFPSPENNREEARKELERKIMVILSQLDNIDSHDLNTLIGIREARAATLRSALGLGLLLGKRVVEIPDPNIAGKVTRFELPLYLHGYNERHRLGVETVIG